MNDPILYTDVIFVNENQGSMAISFGQSKSDAPEAPEEMIVARIGMSNAQAKLLAQKILAALPDRGSEAGEQ